MTPDEARPESSQAPAPVPTLEETIRAEVEPFRYMTPEERLRWFVRLQKSMDAFVHLRGAAADADTRGDPEFWRHWKDPAYGRPR